MKAGTTALRRITHHSISVMVACFLPDSCSVCFLSHKASIPVSIHCPRSPVRFLGLVNSVDFVSSGANSKPLGCAHPGLPCKLYQWRFRRTKVAFCATSRICLDAV